MLSDIIKKMNVIISLQISSDIFIDKTIYIKKTDISLFDNKSKNKRELNCVINKKRELIIQYIINNKIPKAWFHSSISWLNFRYKLLSFLRSITIEKTLPIKCIIKGGRRFNYDFDMVYLINNKEDIKKIEFKFGCSEIQKCPQFLSLSAKSIGNYSEFFYDNYLSQLSILIDTRIPSKETYLKYVGGIDYSKDIWFKNLYNKETFIKEKKKEIVDKSISQYLTIFEEQKHINNIREKILKSQNGKIYMCYDGDFHKDFFSTKDVTVDKIIGFKENKKNFKTTIIFQTKTSSKIFFLLRWRNRAGILNPAWQISIKK